MAVPECIYKGAAVTLERLGPGATTPRIVDVGKLEVEQYSPQGKKKENRIESWGTDPQRGEDTQG